MLAGLDTQPVVWPSWLRAAEPLFCQTVGHYGTLPPSSSDYPEAFDKHLAAQNSPAEPLTEAGLQLTLADTHGAALQLCQVDLQYSIAARHAPRFPSLKCASTHARMSLQIQT